MDSAFTAHDMTAGDSLMGCDPEALLSAQVSDMIWDTDMTSEQMEQV